MSTSASSPPFVTSEGELSPFPVTVKPFANETVSSYFRRLCAANRVDEKDARLVVRHRDARPSYRVRSKLTEIYAAVLGGLPRDAFATGRFESRGAPWSLEFGARQLRGESPPDIVPCSRCVEATDVTIRAWSGPLCLRHRRWTQSDRRGRLIRERAVVLDSHLVSAQRCLNGTLRSRGIGYGSLAVASAREVLRRVKGQRPARHKDEPIPFDLEIAEFEEVVKLTAHLTSAPMIPILLNDELDDTDRGIVIAYVAHVLLSGGDVPAAIAAIRTTRREILLREGLLVAPYIPTADLPPFAQAILGGNDGIRIRLLRFLETAEDRIYRDIFAHAVIEEAIAYDQEVL